MSKAISYYDWELNFRRKVTLKEISPVNKEYPIKKRAKNSLGISDNEFKEFMKNWKYKNSV
jgi:hypothetical protein